jgi:spore germination protein GerM
MNNSIKTPLILVVLLLGLGLTGLGCGWWPFSGGQAQEGGGKDTNIESMSTGTDTSNQFTEIIIGENIRSQSEMVAVELYFIDEKSGKLVSEKREIPKVVGIARAAVEELIRGSASGSGLISAIPLGTSLLDINVRSDGRCIVDLSREFNSNLAKDSRAEVMAVYTLVNTLTQFPTVHEVQFLVDGQKVNSLRGQVDLSQPVVRNEALIKL